MIKPTITKQGSPNLFPIKEYPLNSSIRLDSPNQLIEIQIFDENDKLLESITLQDTYQIDVYLFSNFEKLIVEPRIKSRVPSNISFEIYDCNNIFFNNTINTSAFKKIIVSENKLTSVYFSGSLTKDSYLRLLDNDNLKKIWIQPERGSIEKDKEIIYKFDTIISQFNAMNFTINQNFEIQNLYIKQCPIEFEFDIKPNFKIEKAIYLEGLEDKAYVKLFECSTYAEGKFSNFNPSFNLFDSIDLDFINKNLRHTIISLNYDRIKFLAALEKIYVSKNQFNVASNINAKRQLNELCENSNYSIKPFLLYNFLTSNFQTSITRPLIILFFIITYYGANHVPLADRKHEFNFTNLNYFGNKLSDFANAIVFLLKPFNKHDTSNLFGVFIMITLISSISFMIKHVYNRRTDYKW